MLINKARAFFREAIRQKHQPTIQLDGHSLTLDKLKLLGAGRTQIEISKETHSAIEASRDVVYRLMQSKETYYGINTGVGLFSDVKIPNEDLIELQYNLIRSHATGVGEVLGLDRSRRLQALRINTMAKGYCGVSSETFIRSLELFNSGCVPLIPEQGTVGASGDLVPLAHIGLALIGEGEVWNPKSQQYEPAAKVFQENGLKKAQLQAKDGLSLMNGNQYITAVGSVALEDSIVIMKSISPISALSFLSMKGHPQVFDKSVYKIRMHPGQTVIAEFMREVLPNGKVFEASRDIQNPYSLKCIPQIHGPTLEAIINSIECFELEMNSGSDNPMIFTEEPYYGVGGNYHGEYPAKQLDCLGLYVHEIGSLSSQRIKRLTNPTKNVGLPAFLTGSGGLCSGMMTWENVAASLVSENKVLVYPISCETLETCADKEDHVSMGSISANKATLITENVMNILAVETFAACQAIQHRFRLEKDFYIYHPGLKRIYEYVSSVSPILNTDRYTVPEFNEILRFIKSGEMWDMMLQEMPQSFFDIETPPKEYQTHKQSL